MFYTLIMTEYTYRGGTGAAEMGNIEVKRQKKGAGLV